MTAPYPALTDAELTDKATWDRAVYAGTERVLVARMAARIRELTATVNPGTEKEQSIIPEHPCQHARQTAAIDALSASEGPRIATTVLTDAELIEWLLGVPHPSEKTVACADRLASLSAQVERLSAHVCDAELVNEVAAVNARLMKDIQRIHAEKLALAAQVEKLTKERDELRREFAACEGALTNSGNVCRMRTQEVVDLTAQVEALSKALIDCADDLEASVNAEYAGTLDYPCMMRKFERDMQPVVRAREALNAAPAPAEREKEPTPEYLWTTT